MENVATEEFISRTEALKDFEACNAENPHWTPQRVKTLLLRQPAANVAEVAQGRWDISKGPLGDMCKYSRGVQRHDDELSPFQLETIDKMLAENEKEDDT